MKPAGPDTLRSNGEVILPVGEEQYLHLGQGYDVLSDRFSNAVVADPASDSETQDNQGGQIVRAKIDVIEDLYEFRRTLRISVSAAARMSFGGASAHYSLFRSIQVNSNDVFALLYVSVLNTPVALRDPRLSESAKQEWTHQKASERKGAMIRAFGDSFVSSITSGGEFLAIFRLHTTSRREREEVKASAKASFGLFNAHGSYSSISDELAKHSRITTDFTRIGGEGPKPSSDVESLLIAAQSFPDLVNPEKGGKPRQIYFTALPLGTVPDPETNIDLSARAAMERLEDIARLQDQIGQRLNDAKYIQEAPQLFSDVQPEEAQEMIEALASATTTYGRSAQDVIDDRFGDWDKKKIEEIEDLAVPPHASKGKEVQLRITAAAYEKGGLSYEHDGNVRDFHGSQNEWITFYVLNGITIQCDELPDGTFLEYQVTDRGGQNIPGKESGWTRAGQTATAGPQLGVAKFQARVVGTHASRYTVRYGAKFLARDASYYAEDGNPVSARGLIRALKITVLTL